MEDINAECCQHWLIHPQRTEKHREADIFFLDESVKGMQVLLLLNAGSRGVKAVAAINFCY